MGHAKERRAQRRKEREVVERVEEMTPAEVRAAIADLTKVKGGDRRITRRIRPRFNA